MTIMSDNQERLIIEARNKEVSEHPNKPHQNNIE